MKSVIVFSAPPDIIQFNTLILAKFYLRWLIYSLFILLLLQLDAMDEEYF